MMRSHPDSLQAHNIATIAAARIELDSIIRDAWAIHASTGDESDAEIARSVEAEARAMLALLPEPRPKLKASKKSKKRNAFKRGFRLDASAPILAQIRDLDR